MKIREDVFRTIINCFKQHGANTIDTPILESTVTFFLNLFLKSIQYLFRHFLKKNMVKIINLSMN